jgi:hypothetical protein
MGIVSVFAVLCGFAALVVFVVKMNRLRKDQEDPEVDFGLKILMAAGILMMGAGVLGIINNYFVKIETPFSAPAADLPEKEAPRDPGQRPQITPAEKPDPMKGAKREHRDALDEFEQENSRAEAR